jgi:hypothetical protein
LQLGWWRFWLHRAWRIWEGDSVMAKAWRGRWINLLATITALLAASLWPAAESLRPPTAAAQQSTPNPAAAVYVSPLVTPFSFNGDLRSLPPPPAPGPPREIPEGVNPSAPAPAPAGLTAPPPGQSLDPVLQSGFGRSRNDPLQSEVLSNPIVSFDGVTNVNNVAPPDPVGDVGPNHYVQAVNVSFAIFDRAGNLLAGPSSINSLWAGFMGGLRRTMSDG